MKGGFLPGWDFGNDTLLEEYLDIVFTVTNSVLLCTVCFAGIAANLFVTWAVYRQKSLRTWNNALLVNLAVIDLLRCAIDCPILLAIHLTDSLSGHVDHLLCDAQVTSFSFSCCIQLLTLACISAERYQAIAHPFQTSQRRRRILVFIPLTWTVAILVAVLCLTFVRDSPVYVKCTGLQLDTLISYDTFGLYILVPLWSTCFVVIIGFYARIFIIVRAHSRKIFDKGTSTFSKKNKEKDFKNDVEVDGLKAERNDFNQKTLTQNTECVPQMELVFKIEPQLVSTVDKVDLPNRSEDPLSRTGSLTEINGTQGTKEHLASREEPHLPNIISVANNELMYVDQSKQSDLLCTEVEELSPSPIQETPLTNGVPEITAVDLNNEVDGAVCVMPSSFAKDKGSKKKESKLAKRSGYIIFTFLLCWLPLIVTILMSVLVRGKISQMKMIWHLELLFISVACMTSLSDPIIYAAVNPQFRLVFYNLKDKVRSLCK